VNTFSLSCSRLLDRICVFGVLFSVLSTPFCRFLSLKIPRISHSYELLCSIVLYEATCSVIVLLLRIGTVGHQLQIIILLQTASHARGGESATENISGVASMELYSALVIRELLSQI